MCAHRIFGVLDRDADVRIDGGSREYGVYIELAPSVHYADPIVAHRDYGVHAAGAKAAGQAARLLKRGARVFVHCRGIGLGYTAAEQAAIRCAGVDFIECLDRPVNFHEPREQATLPAHDNVTNAAD